VSFWDGRRVLVTGADGFIGSHLTESLVRAGAEVRAFCLYNSNGSWGWLDEADDDIRRSLDVRLGDIRDARFVEAATEGIDSVFHLAALIAIPYSYQAASSFVDTNIGGTLNMLEAARRAGVRRMINTSTSEVYGTPADLPITEHHPLQGQSPYSATKIGADKLAEAFFASFSVPVMTLRPFNTYGPRQSARAVIPTILSQLLAGRTEIRLGSLEPRRDFTFVADTVTGFLAAGETAGIEGMTIQLGTGRTESIGEIFAMASRVAGVDAAVVTDEDRFRPSSSEVMVLLSDPQRATDILGWRAETDLEAGLRATAEWIGNHPHYFDPDRYAV